MRLTGVSRNSCGVKRRDPDEVKELSERIAALAAERQELRKTGASGEVLEQNRVELGRSQWALCHALIELYLPSAAAA
jgi:hypothetical protein